MEKPNIRIPKLNHRTTAVLYRGDIPTGIRCPKCGYAMLYDPVMRRIHCAGRCGLEIYRNVTNCTNREPGTSNSSNRYLKAKKYMDNYRLTHKRVRQEDGTYKWQKISTTAPAV